MITYKLFSKQVTGLTSKATAENRDKLRDEVMEAINQEIKAENVISIVELIPTAGVFTITVWYRK